MGRLEFPDDGDARDDQCLDDGVLVTSCGDAAVDVLCGGASDVVDNDDSGDRTIPEVGDGRVSNGGCNTRQISNPPQ